MSPNQAEQGGMPLFVADHQALDFLNTLLRVDGAFVDVLQSDEDVLRWLAGAGFSVGETPLRQGLLLQAARELREAIRQLVMQRKKGERIDPFALNAFLAEAQSYPQLAWAENGSLAMQRVRPIKTSAQVLAPIAEVAAELLVAGNFELVKKCEDASCVLWFYDKTKSHHRRWCSMAMCGNRNKVAAYRKRRRHGDL